MFAVSLLSFAHCVNSEFVHIIYIIINSPLTNQYIYIYHKHLVLFL